MKDTDERLKAAREAGRNATKVNEYVRPATGKNSKAAIEEMVRKANLEDKSRRKGTAWKGPKDGMVTTSKDEKVPNTVLGDADYIASLNIKDEKDWQDRLAKKQFSGANAAAKARLAAIRAQGAKVANTPITVKDTVTKPLEKEKVVKKSEPKPVTDNNKITVKKKEYTSHKQKARSTGHTTSIDDTYRSTEENPKNKTVVPSEEKEVVKKVRRKNSRAYKRNYKSAVVPNSKADLDKTTGKANKADTIASLERMLLNAKLTNDVKRMKKYRLIIENLKGQ